MELETQRKKETENNSQKEKERSIKLWTTEKIGIGKSWENLKHIDKEKNTQMAFKTQRYRKKNIW
jgi:hypothetical protein